MNYKNLTIIKRATSYFSKTLHSRQNILLIAISFLLLAPTLAFARGGEKNNRSEINYKQRHSHLIDGGADAILYADGIKIKRDLSLLEEIQMERVLAADEIPAEELYGGLWRNDYVHVYGGQVKNIPDSFRVNLENFTMPILYGHVTSNFGKRGRRMHNGIDLKVQVGDTIYAAFEGKVRVTRYERKGYGNYVAIRHPNGLETIYGHLSDFLVQENDLVKSGDAIGLGGNTGRSTGSHLHLEFRFLGQAINPKELVDFDNLVCHRDEYLLTPKKLDPVRTINKYTNGKMKFHRVKKGDTLYAIARKYGTTVNNIMRSNNLKKNAVLRTGTSLRL